MSSCITSLRGSDEPSIRLKTHLDLLRSAPADADIAELREQVRNSERVGRLLSERDADGQIRHSPYKKWNGAHWVLATLADIGYPSGDEGLTPLRDQVFEAWLSPEHTREVVCRTAAAASRATGVVYVEGRARRHAFQEGNALFSTLTLGIADGRVDQLARNLMSWQWPDGGWNCDRRPQTTNSSFWESLTPLRGLALYARVTGDAEAQASAERAAEVFLKRRLFRRQRDGEVMNEQFTRLHYPWYWRYDLLFGLKVMAEAGLTHDERCGDALDLLESKRMADGGFPAEEKFYQTTKPERSGHSVVNWAAVSRRRSNEWVTAEAFGRVEGRGPLVCGSIEPCARLDAADRWRVPRARPKNRRSAAVVATADEVGSAEVALLRSGS